jgi:rhodanese-related sulfurtransferase
MPVKNLDPRAAKKLLDGGEGWSYLDVRTEEEFAAGRPAGAWNVPVMMRDPAGRGAPNADFVAVVKKAFPAGARLILGCASGVRSMRACEMLAGAGFAELVNVSSGFQGGSEPGWKDCGLPCESGASPERGYAALRSRK